MNVLARFFSNFARHVRYDRVYSYMMGIEISDACLLQGLFLSWKLVCPWQDHFLDSLCSDKACHNLVCDQDKNILVLMNRHLLFLCKNPFGTLFARISDSFIF